MKTSDFFEKLLMLLTTLVMSVLWFMVLPRWFIFTIIFMFLISVYIHSLNKQ